MTQQELSQYYFARSMQADWMNMAIHHFDFKQEENMWYDLLRWVDSKHAAQEIADAHDTMAFATAMGISDGITKAFK
jgi:inorganic pyrophosphatase